MTPCARRKPSAGLALLNLLLYSPSRELSCMQAVGQHGLKLLCKLLTQLVFMRHQAVRTL